MRENILGIGMRCKLSKQPLFCSVVFSAPCTIDWKISLGCIVKFYGLLAKIILSFYEALFSLLLLCQIYECLRFWLSFCVMWASFLLFSMLYTFRFLPRNKERKGWLSLSIQETRRPGYMFCISAGIVFFIIIGSGFLFAETKRKVIKFVHCLWK